MTCYARRLAYKAVLIFTVLSLMLPTSAFAMPIDVAQPLAPSATYTVTSTADDGSAGTLRWAIDQANTNAGSDTIDFAIGTVGSQQTITLTAALPTITDPSVIDGWSQGGAGYTGVPLIELNGAGSTSGLTFSASNSSVRGLVIKRFNGNGITLSGSNHKIQGNYIGTDVSGSMAQGNGSAGVFIAAGSSNIIGTDGDGVHDAAEGNVISGNGYYGININSGDGNRISGNLIGTNAAGDSAIPNSGAGVVLFTSNNLVGSDGNGVGDAAERNVISGNLSHPTPGSCYDQPGDGVTTVMGGNSNHIAGNYIGLNEAGTAAIQNDCEGVALGSNNNIVGTDSMGDSAAQRNVISNNRIANVRIFYMSGNVIAGNYIGTDATGENASTAGFWGVYIDSATSNRVGTNGDGTNDTNERNIIAGNQYIGVDATGGSGNTIAGNWIGLSASGAPLGNGSTGISIDNGSSSNTIGTAGT
ncbi:MAG TPA: hypothetical protein VLG46_00035, partial [Anaerolineae bacterium]|nr:hypothetical protein [Anaerolineae bacterium]